MNTPEEQASIIFMLISVPFFILALIFFIAADITLKIHIKKMDAYHDKIIKEQQKIIDKYDAERGEK